MEMQCNGNLSGRTPSEGLDILKREKGREKKNPSLNLRGLHSIQCRACTNKPTLTLRSVTFHGWDNASHQHVDCSKQL
jgi:hypothetical protein